MAIFKKIWSLGKLGFNLDFSLKKKNYLVNCPTNGIFVPQPGIKPGPSAVRAWSPNHWIARNFQIWLFLMRLLWKITAVPLLNGQTWTGFLSLMIRCLGRGNRAHCFVFCCTYLCLISLCSMKSSFWNIIIAWIFIIY